MPDLADAFDELRDAFDQLRAALLVALRSERTVVALAIDSLARKNAALEERVSQLSDALAGLDAQIDDLVAYVNSDDATDAAEVQARADRIKAALASARAGNPAPQPAPALAPPPAQ